MSSFEYLKEGQHPVVMEGDNSVGELEEQQGDVEQQGCRSRGAGAGV